VQRALDDPRRGRAGGISQRENEPMVKKTTTTEQCTPPPPPLYKYR